MTATEAQNRFGKLLDTAQREPVTIEKKGRPVAVVLSVEDFERLNRVEAAADDLRLQESIDDVLAGRTVPAETVFAEIRKQIQSGESK